MSQSVQQLKFISSSPEHWVNEELQTNYFSHTTSLTSNICINHIPQPVCVHVLCSSIEQHRFSEPEKNDSHMVYTVMYLNGNTSDKTCMYYTI